jgi:hypothetical protein
MCNFDKILGDASTFDHDVRDKKWYPIPYSSAFTFHYDEGRHGIE